MVTYTSPSAEAARSRELERQRQAAAARAAAPQVPTYTPPPAAKPTYSSKPPPGSGGKKKSGGGGKVAAAGSGGDGGIKKSNDAPQLEALRRMIATEFAAARDVKIANINALLATQDAELMRGYGERAAGLEGSRLDNEKSEADSTFGNLANRVRERTDLLEQAASQGAGESDQLKVAMQALRNWDANQGEINRSYFDTVRSVNSAITDLNQDTRSARINLQGQAQGDIEQAWTNYFNQVADAYTQQGNIEANPYSDSYKPGSTAYADAAATAGKAYSAPGIPGAITGWTPATQAAEGQMNNSQLGAAVTNLGQKKPEGATLRKW